MFFFLPACMSWRLYFSVWFLRLQWLLPRKYSCSRWWCCSFYCRSQHRDGGLWRGFYNIAHEQNKIFWRQKVELSYNIKRLSYRHGKLNTHKYTEQYLPNYNYHKYWATLISYHICSKIWTNLFYCLTVCQKSVGWLANSVGPSQMPPSVASDLGLHCLLRPVGPNI